MADAKNGDTVKVHFNGRLEDGSSFGSSAGQGPLEFTIGEGQVIPGFEEAVVGMNEGESKTVTIEAAQAFGERREDMVVEIGRERMPPDHAVEIGQTLRMEQPDGSEVQLVVTGVSEDRVTLDANHPLAGKDLTFEIQLVEIT